MCFDELTQTQFILGFVKNVNDTIDPLMRRFIMADLLQLLELMEAMSWPVVRGAFIGIMHDIETVEITWTDRQSLMQHSLMYTHAAALAPQQPRTQVNNNNIIIILGSYIVLFLLLAQSALHSITPARIANLGNLTYCCHARRRSQYPLKLGTHISPGWREAQTRLTSCPRMLSHTKQLASLRIKPTTLGL